MAIDPNAIIPGKYDLNLRGRKVIGVGGDENDSQFDAANIQQVSGSNVWQESLRNEYTNGQQVRDFRAILQGNVTTDTITHIGGANNYDFDFDVFEKPTDETDQVYFQRFGINPVSGVDIIEVTNVQRNTPGQGQTRITLQPPVNVDFTLTYPPANLGVAIGVTTRNYTRRELEYDGLNDVPRPIDDTYGLIPDPNFRVYVSLYWVASVFNGDNWRPHQDYLEGDTVSYIDNVGVPRHVFCREAHTSSEATSPILSSAVSHTASGFGPTRPWEPIGAAIDLSTGTFEAPVQILGSNGNAAIALNGGSVLNEDRWFINVGQGISAIELPDAQLPAVGDLISFGVGNAGTTEEFRVAARNDDGNTSLRFDGSYPAEVEALLDDRVDNPVNLFNAGLRTDFGQIDRLVFAPDDFAINTEAQDIGHAHISVIGKQDKIDAILGDATTQQATDGVVSIGLYKNIDGTPVTDDVQPFVIKGTGGISINLGVQHGTTGFHSEIEIDGSEVEGGIVGQTSFPSSPSVGDQLYLNVSVSASDGTNQRPRGFYSYIQPSSDPAFNYWEQVTLSEVGQLFNNARVGDIIYLENAETNFNTVGNDFEPGFYRASATATAAPNHTTWTAIGSGDIPEIQGEIDAIQAHEGVIDDRLTELESQVTHLEQTYGGAYIWAGNATINSLLSENRVDSQGNNPSASNILSSEYNEDTNILRWWIAASSSDTEISQLIASGDAIGFSNGILDPIPFVPFESGANATNTAKYIDFKLQQPDTYEATLISYADENEVIFSTTLYFFNTANVNFNQADHDAGDHHIVDVLTAAERALVDGLVAGTVDLTVNDLDVNGGLIVDGGNNADIRFNHSIEVRETNNNATANPSISINRRSNSPLAGDDIGLVEFKGTTTDGTDETDDTNYAVLGGDIVSESTALPVGQLYIKVADGTAATTNQAKHITINGKAGGGATVNLADDTDLSVGGLVNGADSNSVAYVAIQLSAGIPTEITPTGAVAGHVYLQYTARYNGASATLVDDINTTADPVTSTTYVNFVSVSSPGTEIPQDNT